MELEITSEAEHGRVIPITGQNAVFGRAHPADIVMDWDDMISSRHFRVFLEGGRYSLTDLRSTKGTYVNGQRIQTYRLADGDGIRAGRTCFVVRIPNADSAELEQDPEPARPLAFDASYNRPFAGTSSPRTGTIPAPGSPNLAASKPATSRADQITQLRLRIVSALETGKLFWLSPGQSLTFGGSAKSDCCLDFDSQLSSEHFRITCNADGCMAEDLQSTSGTYLNGQVISRVDLFHGDRLLAGETEFEIEVEGPADLIHRPTSEAGAPAKAVSPLAPTSSLVVIKSTCGSGLTRLRGAIPEDASIANILERLRGLGDLYFIIDFSRLSMPLPPEVDPDDSSLFSWLSREAAWQTPQVVAMTEIKNWKILFEEGWGSDAIVCLQSKLDKIALLSELRELALGSAKPGNGSRGVLGFCWPSVMSALLENDTRSFTPRFMKIANLVVTEVAGEAESWQLFGSEETVEKCSKLGLSF